MRPVSTVAEAYAAWDAECTARFNQLKANEALVPQRLGDEVQILFQRIRAVDRAQPLAQAGFNQLKANEEELNRIFIDIYGLQDELTPEVEDKEEILQEIVADDLTGVRSLVSQGSGDKVQIFLQGVRGLYVRAVLPG